MCCSGNAAAMNGKIVVRRGGCPCNKVLAAQNAERLLLLLSIMIKDH
jgi:hypothetical protein